MYCGCKIRIYADNKVAENGGSAETVVYAERYYLLVLNAELLCSCGIKVNMALCNDNALLKVKLAAGTDQLASGSAGNVAALANGCIYSERACIGKGNLDLTCLSCRPEDNYSLDLTLRSDDRNSLLAGELTGLAQILLVRELSALAEQDLDLLLGKMNETRRCFNK